MNELVKAVTEKTGVDAATVTKVATACIDYVKGKLPAPLASQIEGLLNGQPPDVGGSVTSALGGLFGKK